MIGGGETIGEQFAVVAKAGCFSESNCQVIPPARVGGFDCGQLSEVFRCIAGIAPD
jgi:hypothetical protein